MYDEKILAAFSETASLQDWKINWLYQRRERRKEYEKSSPE
jgi:hypothetical protein